jgi:hypothetical protein
MKGSAFNKQGLNCIKFIIESLMENEIEQDHTIPDKVICSLARLHSNIKEFENER